MKHINSIYIKPQRKKCEISDYKTFEILVDDEKFNRELLSTKLADVIVINNIGIEIFDGYIHIFSYKGNGFDLLNSCYTVAFKESEKQ